MDFTDKREVSYIGSRSALGVLVVLVFLYIVYNMDRSLLSVVLQAIKDDLQLTDAQIGSLQTIFYAVFGIFVLPCSIVVDRWSRRKSIGSMTVVWSLAFFFLSMATRYLHMALGVCVMGIAQAGFTAGCITWLSLSFEKQDRARVIGIFNIGIPLGAAVGLLAGGVLVTFFDSWRMPFVLFGFAGLVLGPITFGLRDYATLGNEHSTILGRQFRADLVGILKIRTFVYNAVGTSLWLFLSIGFLSWLPSLLIRTYGMNEARAGLIVGIISLVSIVAAPVGGIAADAWQRRSVRGRMLWPVFTLSVATVFMVGAITAVGCPLVLFIILGLSYSFFSVAGLPALWSIMADVVTPGLRSSANGINGMIVALLGTAWGSVVIGAISDGLGGGASGLKYAILMVSPVGLLSALVIFLGSKYYHQDSSRISDEVVSEK